MYYIYNDIKVKYYKYGNKNKVLLILPGWGNTSKTFYNIINHFKDKYTIYTIDYPGFGKSPIPEKELTIYNYTDLIINFLKEKKILNPIIIAHSFGGRITTLLTGYYKINIDKLILFDIASIKQKKSIKTRLKEKIYKILKKIIKIFPNKEKLQKKLINYFGSTDYKALPPTMHKTFINIINEDLTKYLKYISSETLLIWGEKDQDTPLKDAYKINNLIKESALIIYPNASHFSYLDYPILTNNIINEFIKEKDH